MALPANFSFTCTKLKACVDKSVTPNEVTHFIVGGTFTQDDAPAGSKNTKYIELTEDSAIAVDPSFDVAELDDASRDADKTAAIAAFHDKVIRQKQGKDDDGKDILIDETVDDVAVNDITKNVADFNATAIQQASIPS